VIPVDYNNHQSIKDALSGVDVVISTIAIPALKVQDGIVKAAKDARVKLFVPSEFGGTTEGETEGFFGEKASIQEKLKALDLPYAVFYTGSFSDYIWNSCVVHRLYSNIPLTADKVLGPRYHKWARMRRRQRRQGTSLHLEI
jgi:uncharacterized protein YbjT (DUF2867 family)